MKGIELLMVTIMCLIRNNYSLKKEKRFEMKTNNDTIILTRKSIIVSRKSKPNKQQEQQQLHREKTCVLILYLIKVEELEMLSGYGNEWYRI